MLSSTSLHPLTLKSKKGIRGYLNFKDEETMAETGKIFHSHINNHISNQWQNWDFSPIFSSVSSSSFLIQLDILLWAQKRAISSLFHPLHMIQLKSY